MVSEIGHRDRGEDEERAHLAAACTLWQAIPRGLLEVELCDVDRTEWEPDSVGSRLVEALRTISSSSL